MIAGASPALITPFGLRRTKWTLVFHACMTRGGYAAQYEAVDFPGLVFSKSQERRGAPVRQTFHVAGDEREFDTKEAAAKAWNDLQRATELAA